MRTERLFNHCFYCDEIAENDLVPVGGSMIGSSEAPWKVRVDCDSFFPKLVAAAEKNFAFYQHPSWQSWFTQTAPDIDPELLTHLQSFTLTFEGKRRLQQGNSKDRNNLYAKAAENTVNLSEVFSSNNALCVETSVLAQKYLQHKGIKSFLYSGDMLQGLDPDGINLPWAHTFLVIEHKGQEFVYDPTNPNKLQDGHDLFSLLRPCRSLLQGEELRQDIQMVECTDVMTKSSCFYGVGDGGSVPAAFIARFERSAGSVGVKSKPEPKP